MEKEDGNFSQHGVGRLRWAAPGKFGRAAPVPSGGHKAVEKMSLWRLITRRIRCWGSAVQPVVSMLGGGDAAQQMKSLQKGRWAGSLALHTTGGWVHTWEACLATRQKATAGGQASGSGRSDSRAASQQQQQKQDAGDEWLQAAGGL